MTTRIECGLLGLLMASLGCDEACPGTPIEVVTFEGEVTTNSTLCEGDFSYPSWYSVCGIERGGRSEHTFPASIPSGCGDVTIDVNNPHFIGWFPRLWFDLEGDVVHARGEIGCVTDLGDCRETMVPLPPVRSGWVAIDLISETGRNRGRYELVLDNGIVSGTYDTALLAAAEVTCR